jgi:hypothetical protein
MLLGDLKRTVNNADHACHEAQKAAAQVGMLARRANNMLDALEARLPDATIAYHKTTTEVRRAATATGVTAGLFAGVAVLALLVATAAFILTTE